MILPVERINEILPLCREFFLLANEPGEFNDNFFVEYWKSCYRTGKGVIFANEKATAILGAVCGFEMCTGEKFFAECFMYGPGATRLIKEFEHAGGQWGAKVFFLHNIEFMRGGTVEKIYHKKGYTLKLNRFIKVV